MPSVYAYLRNPKCANTEENFHICAFRLLYMHIYESEHVHIRKRASVYVHCGFHICTYTEVNMRIYGRELPYMCILNFVYAHFWLPYMRMFASIYAHYPLVVYGHLENPKCTYTEVSFRICAFMEGKMRIFRREIPYMRIWIS